MNTSDLLTKRTLLIAGIIIVLSIFAIWLRVIPMLTLGNQDILSVVGSDDPLYNLRQVELTVTNFPNYAWFDPMTMFPHGSNMYWGSLFPTLISVCCTLIGATTRSEIISVGLLVPPVMGAVMVSVMYFVGKLCGDWKTGLVSAAFTAVVSGQYYYRALYGYMDHHIAEVLFSTIFCLLYMYVLMSEKDTKINIRNIHTYKRLLLLSGITGISYLLGLFVMPTMILFAMIVSIFTVVLFVVNMIRVNDSKYLVLINSIVFIVAIIGLIIYGLNSSMIDLSRYSVGHIIAYLGIILATIFLYGIAQFVTAKQKTWLHYITILVSIGIVSAVGLYFISPTLYNLFIASFFSFFGQGAVTTTVQEARGWSIGSAWSAFNYGLILLVGGLIVSIYKTIKNNSPQHIFILIWSAIMLFSTYQHVRYEYYLAVNVALLSAIGIGFLIDYIIPELKKVSDIITSDTKDVIDPKLVRKNKKGYKITTRNKNPDYSILSLSAICIIISLMFAYTSVMYSYSNASSGAMNMNPDWKETLEWMNNNTPDEGFDYTEIYDPDTFEYPGSSYGVMSWWDYGHMITYIAKRIPNANPFQEGITGEAGSSTFFLSTDESDGNRVLDAAKTRYVITDVEMDTGKFWAMATWNNPDVGVYPYNMYFNVQSRTKPNDYETVMLNTDLYYMTMISRLHNFDGSLRTPELVYYIEYADPYVSGTSLPLVRNVQELDPISAHNAVSAFNEKSINGYYATVVSQDYATPSTTIPALQHYRLVHESPTSTINDNIKYVKVFEYVNGAHIKGNGTISVNVVTNTGRVFKYQQDSINGEFIVPYSTTGNNYDVKTVGKYKISGNNMEYEVSESEIMGV